MKSLNIFRAILTIIATTFLMIYGYNIAFGADTCFIGDSFVEGLKMYSDLDADFYDYRGIDTEGILKRDLINKDLKKKIMHRFMSC